MKRSALLLLLLGGSRLFGQTHLVSISVEPSRRILLQNSDSHQQLLVLGHYDDGRESDLTSQARWSASRPQIVELSSAGLVKAVGDGEVVVRAEVQGLHAEQEVQVTGTSAVRTFEFARDIGGIFTRKGCNGSTCHGGVKGRGGFKLSAGVLYPKDDYEWIVKGGTYQVLTAQVTGPRTPRINLAAPEKSLLLLKPTMSVAHGGGRRFAVGSPEYKAILDWIRKGAPYGPESSTNNQIASLEIFPQTVTMERNESHKLIVTAHFADGRAEDFTDQASFKSNDGEVAGVNESGVVKAVRLGETSILVRAAGKAASASIGVIGPRLAHYPDVKKFNFIDDHIFAKLERYRIPPSPLSSDAEFLRRICLDLAGALPPPNRLHEFVADRDPSKREKLIDRLIGSPEFIDYWTFRFDDLFRVAVFSNGIRPKWSQMYADWVRNNIVTNKPYDQVARERLTSEGYDGPTRHFLPYDVIGPPGETMAEEVRVFMGRRLDCAQCHNHPYESWSQDQFWGLAAFFTHTFKMGDTGTEYVIFEHPSNEDLGNSEVNGTLKVYHPRTKAELVPTLLDGTKIDSTGRQNVRKALADWMTHHPYFAEEAVNRMWSYFFGRGLVEPVDDFRSTNPPTHPELLARLAEDFRTHNHDLRRLMRLIVTSRAYQLSGEPEEGNGDDRTNYSHAAHRPLDAEVLLDAISDVTGVPEVFTTEVTDGEVAGQAPAGTRAVQLRESDVFYSRFLELYGRPNRLTVPERSTHANLPEAMHMLAGAEYNEKLNAPGARLQKLIAAGKSDEEIIREFYEAAFARAPEPAESASLVKMIAARQDREPALEDFVWAILCSREFAENH